MWKTHRPSSRDLPYTVVLTANNPVLDPERLVKRMALKVGVLTIKKRWVGRREVLEAMDMFISLVTTDDGVKDHCLCSHICKCV